VYQCPGGNKLNTMKKKKINKEPKQKESKDSSSKHKSKVSGGKHKHPGASHRGVIEITRSGMGYVTVVDMERDVIVRPQHFNTDHQKRWWWWKNRRRDHPHH
jgi:hypothetical protein